MGQLVHKLLKVVLHNCLLKSHGIHSHVALARATQATLPCFHSRHVVSHQHTWHAAMLKRIACLALSMTLSVFLPTVDVSGGLGFESRNSENKNQINRKRERGHMFRRGEERVSD